MNYYYAVITIDLLIYSLPSGGYHRSINVLPPLRRLL